jgi:gluconolactonase
LITMTTFAQGLSGPEGPLLLPDATWLVVEMGADRGCVTKISQDGSDVQLLARTGRPNGLALDRHGTVWIAESYPDPALLTMSLDGAWEVFARTASDGTPFLFPNDLCFGPDGMLYVTDSGIYLDDWAPGGNLKPNWAELPVNGRVLRVNPQTAHIDVIDERLQFPNGIACGADGYLYVNEMIGGAVYRYRLNESRDPGKRETFGGVNNPALSEGFGPAGFRGPDGMKFGADGNLYVTVFGQQDVTVLDAAGDVARRVETEGKFPSNLAFGPRGSTQIFVTEGEFGAIEIFNVETSGAELYG